MADAEAALRGATLKDWGRLLAGLLRRYRRPGLVEDVLAEAFAPAARAWTPGEIPANPTGWLQKAADRCIYLAFTAWYAPGGDALVRIQDTVEAVRLALVAESIVPDGQNVLRCLAALLLLQHSRRDARSDDQGRIVVLAHQDRSLWRGEESASAVEGHHRCRVSHFKGETEDRPLVHGSTLDEVNVAGVRATGDLDRRESGVENGGRRTRPGTQCWRKRRP